MDKQTFKYLLAVIFLAVLIHSAAFLHGLFSPEIRLLPDSHEYLSAADNMKEHGVFYSGSLKNEIDYSLYSRRPPGYPFFLMILSLFLPSISLPVIVQVLLVFSGGIFLWRINEKMKVPAGLNILVLAVYLLYPSQIFYSQMIMAETALQFLILASVFFLSLFLDRKTWVFIVMVDVCLGLAVLFKPVLLYFWLPNLVLHLLLFRKFPRKIILVSALIPVLFISLWSWRNYQVTGVYHFSSLKAVHMKFSIPGSPDEFESGSKADFKEEFENTESSAIDVMLDPAEVGDKLLRISRNMATFFLDPGRFDVYRFIPLAEDEISSSTFFHPDEDWRAYFRKTPTPVLFYLGILLVFNLCLILAFIPFPFIARIDFFLRLYFLLLILYMNLVVSVAALGASRYRLPVEPLLLAGAAVVVSSAWRKYKPGNFPGTE